MRHMEDLALAAERRGIARYSSFLSDREQSLCEAAMNRAGCTCCELDGGYPAAERKIACVEPEGCWAERPVVCVQIQCQLFGNNAAPQHKDYLGSLLGLAIKREGIGDIILADAGVAYVFALAPIAELIVSELHSVGRVSASARILEEELPENFGLQERVLCSATVSSLRLDAVLAAMLRCSRGMASDLITAGRVEINHIPVESSSADVYAQDVFTVRGKGRFQLVGMPGKSKKGRQIIEYFQY